MSERSERIKYMQLPQSIYSPERVNLALFYLGRYKTNKKPAGAPLFVKDFLNSVAEGKEVSTQVINKAEKLLNKIKKEAPHVRMVLSVSAEEEFKQKITKWFRQNINKNTLVSFAADSSLAGGFMLRTPQKSYDFSFRKNLQKPKKEFIQVLKDI